MRRPVVLYSRAALSLMEGRLAGRMSTIGIQTMTATDLPTTAIEACAIIAAASFRPLTDLDREAFADAGADARIWEDQTLTVLVSGDRVEFLHIDANGHMTDAAFDFSNRN